MAKDESEAYRVEADEPPCGSCGRGGEFAVVGPDGTALPTTFEDEDDALDLADDLNVAYRAGVEAMAKRVISPPTGAR